MSNAVILTAHGELAKGVQTGLNLVVGPMENLRVVNFHEGDTFETIDAGLKEAFDSLESAKNVLFLTDLMGGTPFNRSVMGFADRPNVRVLSGLNFGMAYQGLISEEEDIEKYASEVLEAGKESMGMYEVPEEKEDTNEESDGI